MSHENAARGILRLFAVLTEKGKARSGDTIKNVVFFLDSDPCKVKKKCVHIT